MLATRKVNAYCRNDGYHDWYRANYYCTMTPHQEGTTENPVCGEARDRSRTEIDCESRLGEVGAQLFFVYARLDRKSRQELAAWTQKLQASIFSLSRELRPARLSKAGHRLANITKITKIQVSQWDRANPLPKIVFPDGANPSYRVFPLFFAGMGAASWKGILLMIYEVQSNRLFHRFISLTVNNPLTSEWLLHSVGLAIRYGSSESSPEMTPSTVCWPNLSGLPETWARPFRDAMQNLASCARSEHICSISWRRKHQIDIDARRISVAEYVLPEARENPVKNLSSARRFETMLKRISNAFGDADSGGWIGLNPNKSIDRLDPDRYSIDRGTPHSMAKC